MDKFAERKKFTSCKLVAAAAVAMCLLGSAGFEANAAPPLRKLYPLRKQL